MRSFSVTMSSSVSRGRHGLQVHPSAWELSEKKEDSVLLSVLTYYPVPDPEITQLDPSRTPLESTSDTGPTRSTT